MELISSDHNIKDTSISVNSKEKNTTKKPIYSGFNHSFDVGVAAVCGIEAACLFNHIRYWTIENKIRGINEKEGIFWTYDTHTNLIKYLPYLSARQIKYGLKKLVDHGLIIIGNFNPDKFDKTSWYAIAADKEQLKSDIPEHVSKNVCEDVSFVPSIGQNCPIEPTDFVPCSIYSSNITYTNKNTSSLKVSEKPDDSEKKLKVQDFSEEVKEAEAFIVAEMKAVEPDCVIAKNALPRLKQLQLMVEEGVSVDSIRKVFKWAVNDHFWSDKMFKPNPIVYLRKNFNQLQRAMNKKPTQSLRPKGFAPASSDERCAEIAREMEANAI